MYRLAAETNRRSRERNKKDRKRNFVKSKYFKFHSLFFLSVQSIFKIIETKIRYSCPLFQCASFYTSHEYNYLKKKTDTIDHKQIIREIYDSEKKIITFFKSPDPKK